MINGKNLFLLIFFTFKVLSTFAQRDSIGLTTIVTKTEKLSSEHPFEKVYLHFDKPYYAVSDTIWFKAYLTIGPRHRLSILSNIIYVDVFNSRDSLVKALKLPAVNGLANGDIILSASVFKEGNYHLRAYTNWMRNFGDDYFFNKTLTIGDAFDNTLTPEIFILNSNKKDNQLTAKLLFRDNGGKSFVDKKVNWEVKNDDETVAKGHGVIDKNGGLTISFARNQLNAESDAVLVTEVDPGNKKSAANMVSLKTIFAKPDVQFFPEGGELITGVRSKVAFKAINANGLGIDVSGSVVDDDGNDVADFKSRHAGMGIFPLLPENGKSYKAVVTFPDGTKGNFELPKVRSEGIAIAVNNNDPENLSIKVAANPEYFKEYQNKGFYIIAQSGGVIYYTTVAALQSLVYTAVVPKSKFPTGVLQITLFAANGEPLSERVAFIQHNDALNLSLSTNLHSYNILQHVMMTVTAKTVSLPVTGSFSLAVIDETKAPFSDDAETTILSSLLLTSDLRGYIEKPNYYFNSSDSERLADLDILMLTQGYRRFSYSDILADKYPPVKFLPEHGIEISGTLRTLTGLPVNRGNVNMRLSDRNFSTSAVTDADGHFKFSGVSIPDSTKVVLSARNNAASSNLMILVDAQSSYVAAKKYNTPDEVSNIDSVLNSYLQNSKKQRENMHVLKEVVIKGSRIKQVTHENYTNLTGLSSIADQTLSGDAFQYCNFDFESCVMGKVFGLWHIDDRYYIKKDYDAGNKDPIQFFVNGEPIEDDFLKTLNPADMESMEVYLKDGFGSLMRFYRCNGIISITMKKQSASQDQLTANLAALTSPGSEVTIMPKGFYKKRVFYSPVYTNEQAVSKQINDLRSTIYWNPNIITDKNGNATIDFYNSSGRGTYKAVIEGIDADGNIGRYTLSYKVN